MTELPNVSTDMSRTPNPVPPKPSVHYIRTTGLTLDRLAGGGLGVLSPEERAALDRLKPLTSKRDYLAAHLALRISVARVLGIAPREVPLEYHASGRPLIAGTMIQVSLSHCLGLGACAVSGVGDLAAIGIDAEPLTAGAQVDEVKDLALSQAEQAWAASAGAGAGAERQARLVALWTAKEAVLKARGVGLSGSDGVNGLLQVECRPVHWQARCQGEFDAVTERVTTRLLPGDYCLAFAKRGSQPVDQVEPEELWLPDEVR